MDYTSRNHSKYLIMVHLIFVCKYRMQLLIKYGNQIKQILNDIAEEKHFWNERILWGDGYFACSIGNVNKEIIEKYIQSQG
ncbi:transposase [Clostridium sp. CM028]|nr:MULTISPECIES: transposase [unclassified Clostridium]MBW9145600.1 transposase [Clostridium sp. CM027]MBW9149450.1 transposase [Clostridium sp. CM028]UVE41545.1 transposase [Clostridium sp. CM027]WLC62195.1 transposase [Clostridium sp. CM028]